MRKDDNGFVIVNPLEELAPVSRLHVNSTRTVKRRDDLASIKNHLEFLGFEVEITEKHRDRENLAAKVRIQLNESFDKHCPRSQQRAHALILALKQSGFHGRNKNVIDIKKFALQPPQRLRNHAAIRAYA